MVGITVEGSALDRANHANLASGMIKEEIDFGTAVQGAVDYLDNNIIGNNWNNTMLIVIPKLEHT